MELTDATGLAELEPFDPKLVVGEALNGKLSIRGRMAFGNLWDKGGAHGVTPKHNIQIGLPKGSEDAKFLFAVCDWVGRKTWGEGCQELKNAAFALANGLGGMEGSKVTIYDGDLDSPEWNGGTWIIKASGHTRPLVFVRPPGGGPPIVVERAEDCPGQGDGVTVILDVWAQKSRDRVNLRLLGVILEIKGRALQGPTPEQIEAAVSAQLLTLPAPTSIAGVLPAGEVAEGPAPQIAPQRGTQAVVPAGPEEGAIFRDTVPAEEGGPELIDL